MNSQKEKIIQYAKILYLEVNADGNRVNTFESISHKVHKKFTIEIHYSTIVKWSKKYDWENTFIKIKQAGIEKGKEQLQEKENKLIDEKAQAIADIYKGNKTIQKIAQQTLISRLTGQPLKDGSGNEIKSEIFTNDIIRLLQHSEQTILNLHDKGLKPGSEDAHRLLFKKFDNDR
jgi:organic radical activating enzyme